ncbi:MAG: hypothetical protein ACRCW6_03255 [Mycoplasmoidaceae bacterium]
MFKKEIFFDIIIQELKSTMGIKKFPSIDDIIMQKNLIIINVELDKNFNIYQLAVTISKQLKYKLIDNTDNRKLALQLNIVNL